MSHSSGRGGFTIVEVLIAIVILAVGMLALATTSIFATTQVRIADLKTEESLAVQRVIEQLRSVPFDSLRARSEANAEEVGAFDVWWSLTPQNRYLTRVTLFTRGPGYRTGTGWVPAVLDTFVVEIAKTVPD
ncbi:MAG TPA: prepilin-type N-terminal cleavage/methylation domain-containing protein [Longimicrobiales bacterium]|nr:prepilin-type N-terminal cleavage/methylation domain-containing protein [Longimicrobiales bacterium]